VNEEDRGITRRDVLYGGAALAGIAVAGGLGNACVVAQPPAAPSASLGPPETRTLRVPLVPMCDPWYAYCEPFLREEGFTDLTLGSGNLSTGDADLGILYGNSFVGAIDAGTPLVALAGMHTGCIMVFARAGINSISDFRGKTIAINTKTVTILGKSVPSTEYGFLLSLLAYIGIQPSDLSFVEVGASGNVITPFIDGKVDAIFTAAAGGPLLMADPKNPGHVILDSSADKPWSQNYCCLLVTSRDWYSAHPVAAKRMTRAILRATDAAKKDLRGAAKATADKGTYKSTPAVTEQIIYDIIKDESFDWRQYDPDDTVRFFALRLADAKLVKKTPQQILTDGADFAYFRQLRKELPA
jgi:NitT/TauT family transport system substrate-binding protein